MFRVPLLDFTNQGRNFESKHFLAVCELLQVHKARNTLYRPSVNDQVEWYNHNLKDAV